MAKIEWIKLSVDLFTDEKISRLEAMKNGDKIVLIWIRLLLLAGKQNNGGVFKKFTKGMFASLLSQPKPLINKAFEAFEENEMISVDGDDYSICNWTKHQSEDRMSQIRQKDRERKKKKKSTEISTENSTEIPRNSLFKNKESKNKENTLLTESTKESAPTLKKYGRYENVFFTDEEYAALQTEFPDYEARVERLSAYMASTGKSYDNHLATIRIWAGEDTQNTKKNTSYDIAEIDRLL